VGATWVHRLLEIDAPARVGVCQKCGPVRLQWKNSGAGKYRWACMEGYRAREARKQAVRQLVADRLEALVCERCGFTAVDECQLDPDHIVPIGKGGAPLDPENIQVICANCHRLKTKLEQLPPGQEWRIGTKASHRRR
jgi:5-methylcytosine-specific restriction endonuclease McrA